MTTSERQRADQDVEDTKATSYWHANAHGIILAGLRHIRGAQKHPSLRLRAAACAGSKWAL
eukprot:3677206-Pleurochrysis_carterae.AAC.2